jgi:hypothetical protein
MIGEFDIARPMVGRRGSYPPQRMPVAPTPDTFYARLYEAKAKETAKRRAYYATHVATERAAVRRYRALHREELNAKKRAAYWKRP